MGGINDEKNLMLTAERQHGLGIQHPINALPVMQRKVLLTRLRTIVIKRASLRPSVVPPNTRIMKRRLVGTGE